MSKESNQDLLNAYPDLSDEEEDERQVQNTPAPLPNSQPHKIVKPNETLPSQPSRPLFKAPMIFGGKAFLPPPPPPSSKNRQNNYTQPPPQPPPIYHQRNSHDSSSSNPQRGGDQHFNRPERQRKNCVYVKNIPKHYNQIQKLMTFFKNEGPVREIKVNLEQSSAVVRFAKQEDSIKFINSKKPIFNRSFITYSLNQKDTVPADLIKQKENEETGKVKKPVEVEMKIIRERLDSLLAEKIRALLFLRKNTDDENILGQLKIDLESSINTKNSLAKYSIEELENANKMISNEYDWTLSFTTSKSIDAQKKNLFFDLQKKFGPIASLQSTLLSVPAESIPVEEVVQAQSKQESIVKLFFLGIKTSWEFFYKHTVEPDEDFKGLQVEGVKLRSLFVEGILKKPTLKPMKSTGLQREEGKDEKDELVEILQNGEVKVINEQSVIQPQVDQQQVAVVLDQKQPAQEERPE